MSYILNVKRKPMMCLRGKTVKLIQIFYVILHEFCKNYNVIFIIRALFKNLMNGKQIY
jgi:hypothetical protein